MSHMDLIHRSSQKRISMGFLKLRLFVVLIFTATILRVNGNTGSKFSETDDSCLPDNVIPTHYNIDIIPKIEEANSNFYGYSDVFIKICRTILDIGLHSTDKKLNKLATELIHYNGTIYKPMRYNDDNENLIILMFKNEIPPGIYILHIEYTVGPSTQKGYYFRNLYTDKEGYRAWFVINPFVSVSIGQGSVCFDNPILKPTFNIVIKHHMEYKALSNMPIQKQRMTTGGMIRTHFITTPGMSICATIVALVNFDRVHNVNETVPNEIVNMWCRSNVTSQVKFAQYVAEKVAQEMTWYTNTSAEIPKTDHIAIPNLTLTDFSNWGLIVYNEGNITYDDSEHDAIHKRHVAKIMAQKMIHQWFGNLVTSFRWFDTWLSEGFASFLQAYILNKIFENWRTMDFLVVENLHKSFRMDTNLIMRPLRIGIYYPRGINAVFPAFYDKAPVILRMLQHIITEDVFRKGVIIYLRKYQFKSAGTEDLWAAMQTAMDESFLINIINSKIRRPQIKGFKIREVMDPWINQTHYPLVTVTRNYETGKMIISQEHYSRQQDEEVKVINDNKWWIPITFTVQISPDFSDTMLNFRWLSPKGENISSVLIDSTGWVILNIQQTGYYRVNYDNTNWLKIASYLNSEEYKKIHVLNRAQLIDDSFNLMYHGKLKPEIFFNISSYLSRETDYIAWYPMFQILFKLQNFFGLPESKLFKSHIVGIFDALLENVGNEDVFNEDDITRLKRLNATYWACTVGNPLCLKMATTKLEKHLSYLHKSDLSPYWYQWTYCFGLKTANVDTWRRVWQLYQKIREQKLLEFLACSDNLYIIENYLTIVSSNNLEETAKAFAFRNIITKHISKNYIFHFILDNFMRLKPKSISMCDALKEIISNVCSRNQLRKIRNFVRININVDCIENINVMQERMWYIDELIDKDLEQIMKQLQIQSK